MENDKTFTCEHCGKLKNEEAGSFIDEQEKKFCCMECCKTGKMPESGEKKKPLVCEFC